MKKIYKFLIGFFLVNPKNTILKHPIYIEPRRDGKTTRLVDKYIQDFFTKGQCTTIDHHPTRDASLRVLYLVTQRLHREHNIQDKDLIIKKNSFKIIKK